MTALAQELAGEIDRLSGGGIPVIPCTGAAEARRAYAGDTILFGSPAAIAEVIADMPAVEWVQSSWAGVAPLIDAPRRDYLLTGVKDVFGPQMAEYTLGTLLAHELRLFARRDAQARHEWLDAPSGTLAGRRLGIMGTGSIGRAIAAAATAFDLEVAGFSRSGAARPGFHRVWASGELHAFLGACDYLVSTLPATPDTDRLLDRAALAALPRHAYLVNVGRGNVLDERALVDALRRGQLAGATLDVFDREPLPDDSPLWDVPGLRVTAHVAAASHPALLAPVFVDNYWRFVRGEPLRYRIDFDAGY